MFSLLQQQIKSLDIFRTVYEDLNAIKALAQDFRKYENVLVFGTGGSSLGAKALVEFRSLYDGQSSRVLFLENVDAKSFMNTVSKCKLEKTGIIVISKSGRTTETLLLFSTLIEMWPRFDFKNNAIAITEESTNNDLRAIAEQKQMRIINHHKEIGGRFSVFSVVGLLPAAISGVSIDSFIGGAQRLLSEITGPDCKIYAEIKNVVNLLKNGIHEHVIFSYSDFMSGFGKWITQLISESLGKRQDFGITPVNAIGTIDQHSMLQLFLGGPNNKYYTVITQKNSLETPRVENSVNTTVMNSLGGHNIRELMYAHQKATIKVLKDKAHVRVFEFDELKEEALGYMMMLAFVETIALANLMNLDPFDQPAVEESKKLAIKYLAEL